jgi:hypothetical protein
VGSTPTAQVEILSFKAEGQSAGVTTSTEASTGPTNGTEHDEST